MSFPVYSEYKRSGVEWLGDVPDHWNISPLKLSASCNDTVLPDSTDNDYEIEYVEISDVNEMSGIIGSTSYKFADAPSRARRMLQDGDVLVSTVRTYLRAIAPVVTPPENLIASTGFAVVRPRKGILDGAFLGYLLRAEWWISEVIARSVGVSYPAINASQLIGLNVPVPAWHEQTQIASFLDHETARIDALIEEQQRLIELLKEKRQAVISHAVTKGLDHTVPMKNSGVEWLGEVPAHWVVSRAKLVSDIFVPQRNKPELNDSEGIAWVTMEDMNGGYISATNLKVTELAADEAGSKVLKKGAVIASCVGRFSIVAINAVDVVINQQLQAFEPRKIKAEYLKNIVSLSKEYFELIGTAATLVYVNQQGFENLPVLIPSGSEQESICLYVDEANARFDALLSQSFESIQLLKERRSALISAAVTGKIDVRGWQPPASAPTPELAQEAV